jgi:thiamine pyrophosphokinase
MSSPAAAGTTVVVVTGAFPLQPRAVAAIPDGATLIAADGGLDHALAAGLAPSVLVGDLDSVTAAGLTWSAGHDVDVVRYPVDKAATDTELAVAHAATLRPDRLILVAGGGDRIDHAVAALGALGAPELDGVASVEAWWGDDELRVIHGPGSIELDHPAGTTFSVLAMHGACEVTISGARWPLDDHPLGPLVGLGVSNQVAAPPVTVTAGKGILTVVVPGMRP